MPESNNAEPAKPLKPKQPLKLHNLLINNVNSWGNVEYNIPLRISQNETRTGTSIALRHIPDIPYLIDTKIDKPWPDRVCGRDPVVVKETYRTTSGEYCVKPNPNKAMERADCAINCKRISFMNMVEKKLLSKTITKSPLMSEMKDNYRGLAKSPLAPQPEVIKPPDPEYIFDVVASGRAEVPPIYDTAQGYRRLLDPYYTTYRQYYRPFTEEELYGIGAKDHITQYTEKPTPRVRGFGPRFKEIWMPLQTKIPTAVFDRVQFSKECKEVASSHNPVDNIKGVFESEYNNKYKIPFALSSLASWSNEELFDFAPFPPNPYQTNCAPFMYCSDYCHYARSTSPQICIEQYKFPKARHQPCRESYIVSRD